MFSKFLRSTSAILNAYALFFCFITLVDQVQGLLAGHAIGQRSSRWYRDIAASDECGNLQAGQGVVHADSSALGLRLDP